MSIWDDAEGGGILELFHRRGTVIKCRKGELILHAEDEAPGMFYIESGFVKVYSVNDRGEQYVLAVYGPDELFPLLWLARRARRNVFYEALAQCSLLRVRSEDLEQAVRTDNAFCLELIERSLEQHGMFIDRINNLQHKFARERLVYCLLHLAQRFGVRTNGEYEIGMRVSHQVLADKVNLSRESVGREIDRLVRKGMVAIRDGHIVLRDIPGLVAELPGPSVSGDWWGLVSSATRHT